MLSHFQLSPTRKIKKSAMNCGKKRVGSSLTLILTTRVSSDSSSTASTSSFRCLFRASLQNRRPLSFKPKRNTHPVKLKILLGSIALSLLFDSSPFLLAPLHAKVRANLSVKADSLGERRRAVTNDAESSSPP